VTVEVDARLGGETLFTNRAITSFVEGRTLRLDMFLAARCLEEAATCREDETCRREGCVPAEVDPDELPAFDEDCERTTSGPGWIDSPLQCEADGWTFAGDARMQSSRDRALLTEAEWNQAGAMVWDVPVRPTRVSASFALWMGGGNRADGMTFGMFDASADLPGGTGGALGAMPVPGLAVEFDTHANSSKEEIPVEIETSSNHVGIDDTGTGDSLASSDDVPDLSCSCWIPVEVDFDCGRFGVSVDGRAPLIHVVPGFAPFDAVLAFTGSTGGATDVHAVGDVRIEVDESECP
jgi:hypothetical protein